MGASRGRRSPTAGRAGVRYDRAYNQNAVCMPARSTMLTGQYVRTHGVYANGVALPVDAPSTVGQPNGLEKATGDWVLTSAGVVYDGTEGELYDVEHDPHQWRNLWNEPAYRGRRSDLVADLYACLPEGRAERLPVDAPA